MSVLIVDDAATIRKQLSVILKEFGFSEIIEAQNVDDAWQILSTTNHIQLIFSDWHMPKQTGLDFLKKVRENKTTKGLPFILLTTEQERSKIIEAARFNLQGYLFKPIQKEVIRQRLDTLGLLQSSIPS